MQILASIGQLEFFYNQAPDVMRSCSMALQLLSVAIGSYGSGALVYAVGRLSVGVFTTDGHSWLPDDLNHGRVDLFFLLLAGVCPSDGRVLMRHHCLNSDDSMLLALRCTIQVAFNMWQGADGWVRWRVQG